MLRIIANTLARLEYKDVTKAINGEEAFEAYTLASFDKPFDIIITDWNMPVMNGLEFVKKVRVVNKEIPIVMVTTEGGKMSVLEALRAGVNNYIVKPFTPQVLKEKISAILGVPNE